MHVKGIMQQKKKNTKRKTNKKNCMIAETVQVQTVLLFESILRTSSQQSVYPKEGSESSDTWCGTALNPGFLDANVIDS